ncbi:N-acetylneuraminate synthase family protein [Deefgea piscis]|uniref:N-acetylneuraminate synthase family protein n=1 Tax=Deefgea piscis TaxID=2739061 RepID=A0A6M8ST76_9NEIS|nr:N-acetylneuraminate synthase family protein [Deefgea piscis]QKJ67901.1 N-acetylneuraminate synthase family protein [Deefgea piscis]
MSVYIGKRKVGDGEPCFITFEAGPTHDGLESAKRLVKYAAESGADAVKFQIFDPDRLCADKKQTFSYDVLVDRETGKLETIEESLYELLCRRCLTNNEWRVLKKYCDDLGLAFFSTVSFDEDIALLEELGCDSIKIASADINHFPLIRKASKTGMCIQIDTGSASLGEVEAAVDVIRSEGNENIIIHQCPSGYPARLSSINLNIIKTLKQMFTYPVAFSDHTPGCDMDIAALALGVNLLEKTITENRMQRSVEHVFSLEPFEMNSFIQTIRDVETALGTKRRILHKEELTRRLSVRRSVYIKESAEMGQRLCDVAVEFRRPGFGISPDVFEKIKHMRLNKNLHAEHAINYSDLED